MGGAHHTFCMEAHMFCMESGSKSGKLWLAPLIEPKPNTIRERSDAMAPYRILNEIWVFTLILIL